VFEDEMALQDLLDFDSTISSGYNGDRYVWKELAVPAVTPFDACNRWRRNKMVEITGCMLDGE
jgi:hypothetical protein